MQNTSKRESNHLDPMSHPGQEEWMTYLYGELPFATMAVLEEHLRICPSCQIQVAAWRSTMNDLKGWALPARAARFRLLQPVLKWGIAALFVLGLGYGVGRLSAPALNVTALRSELEASLRASLEKDMQDRLRRELREEFKTMLASAQQQLIHRMDAVAQSTLAAAGEHGQRLLSAYDENRQDTDRATLATVRSLESRVTRQTLEQASLRRDLETVAVVGEASFRRAREQMVELAGYTLPSDRK